MDQIIPRLLRFDRFALDLTRGCLRAGDQEIALRPKAFEVLRLLAENAGQLVSKPELFESVRPNVTVTDDLLVQCIRELRDKLGDTDHRLIKTVPRRGYLLNVPTTYPVDGFEYLPHVKSSGIAGAGSGVAGHIPQLLRRYSLAIWAAAAVVTCFVVAAAYLGPRVLSPSAANDLFTEHDARRTAAIAAEKGASASTISDQPDRAGCVLSTSPLRGGLGQQRRVRQFKPPIHAGHHESGEILRGLLLGRLSADRRRRSASSRDQPAHPISRRASWVICGATADRRVNARS